MMHQQQRDELDEAAFELFARVYPHEAYAAYPERFWEYFHQTCPVVTKDQMLQMLVETAAET